ncbi:MAG TPA: orotate phosphoribosyltransferase [Phenylobacterium sp.]|nr:orotate phosphoribosyltransferase [Phenylobacterium sp.]
MEASARAALAAEVDRAARLKGTFTLRSGQVSDEYFDKYRFEADPVLLARVAAAMLCLVPPGTEVLAGLELGGVPIATAMSLQSGKPAAFVRKEAKTYGTCLAVEGGSVQGRKVVMIEDVISTGGAVRDAYHQLTAAGAEVLGVVCAIWRGAGEPRIEGVDLPVFPALTRNDLEAART